MPLQFSLFFSHQKPKFQLQHKIFFFDTWSPQTLIYVGLEAIRTDSNKTKILKSIRIFNFRKKNLF